MQRVIPAFLVFLFLICVGAEILCPGPSRCDSGFIQTNFERDHQLFYWFFEGPSEQSPLILWMNGGPGCPSEYGAFYENVGKYSLERNSTSGVIQAVPSVNSWTDIAHVLVLDQPAGAGYAYSPDPLTWFDVHTPTAMAEVYIFLQKFFNDSKHAKFQNSDFYVMAESYGGHYAPELVGIILQNNQDVESVGFDRGSRSRINLKGVGLGNGWVHPISQYWGYVEMAWVSGLINKTLYDSLLRDYDLCRRLLEKEEYAEAVVPCEALPTAVLAVNPHMSMYNIHTQCPGFEDHLCPRFPLLDEFMNYDSTRKFNHAGKHKWRNLMDEISATSVIDSLISYRSNLVTALSSDIRVLVYNGDYDFAANWVGAKKWIGDMPWRGQKTFNGTKARVWKMDNKVVGWVTAAEGLTYVQVHKSGHMVPMYQPKVAQTMLDDWLNNRPIGIRD